MKKHLLLTLTIVSSMLSAQAQQYYKTPKFFDNWSIGISGGVMTPLKNHAFFGDMRGGFAFHLQKQITPIFALGLESTFGHNTASWFKNNPIVAETLEGNSSASIDNIYVGAYGAISLFNLFDGYKCKARLFDIEVQGGAGWGYDNALSENYFATKAGLNFNFNCSKNFTLSLRPSVSFNMTGTSYAPLNVEHTSIAYTREKATFNFMVGFTYNWGPGFKCVQAKNQSEIDALNAKINELRNTLDSKQATLAANQTCVNTLEAELEACKKNKKETPIEEKVSNKVKSIRYVFFSASSSKITIDQQPNVEMVANYLETHKDSNVEIKGYASVDGNKDFNEKLAAARAESVKEMLIKKYGIDVKRIVVKGEGIGNLFSENSWNRVAICTLKK